MVMKTQVMGVYSEFVSLVTLSSALQSFRCVCVESGHTCIYTKLTLRLHHARHSCSILCDCSFLKLALYLPSWLFNAMNNSRTPPFDRHISSLQILGLYHIQDIDCIEMVDDHGD